MNVTVFAEREQDRTRALHLAEHLGTQTACSKHEASQTPLALHVGEDGLSLVGDGMTLHADFSTMLPRLRPGKLQNELLVRAAKIKGVSNPKAFDATAGLGEDSFLLAAAGFEVDLYESDSVIAALLQDALLRAQEHPELAKIVNRMHFHEGDSVEALAQLAKRDNADQLPDVVYLDPMFPARTKSAAVKKKFQLLHHLERPCSNQEEMLDAALSVHPRKTVIKRPPKGPYLANRKPSYSLAGKAVRYDCIVPPPRSS